MITQLILDQHDNGSCVARAGTPVRIVDIGNDSFVQVQLPDGSKIAATTGGVSSGIHSPEETLSVLSARSGVKEDTFSSRRNQGA